MGVRDWRSNRAEAQTPAAPAFEAGGPVTGEEENPYASAEQARYAWVLDLGMKLGLALLIASFLVYVFGLLEAHVPLQHLPLHWTKPVGQFLQDTGTPTGWGWLALIHRGDILNLVGVGLLSGISVLCLVAVLPLYMARRDRAYAAIVTLEIAVLLLAASGILTAGH